MIEVILPVWVIDQDLLDLTRNTIHSLRQTDGGVKLIVVDNASTVGVGEIRELSDVYIRLKENHGYAPAVNMGLKLAGEIVCVSNNDIRVPPHWANLAKEILQVPHIGSVHYRMIPYNQPFNPGNEIWPEGMERWGSSSFFVMRNKQLYDENFKNGVEDWDYWKRFRQLGFTTAYTNKAEYQHMDSSSQQRLPSNQENQKKNIEYFISKWGTTPEEDFEELYPGQLAKQWKPFP